MTKSVAVQKALTLDKLKLPAAPKVVGLEVEDYVDHTGEGALMVWVVLDEDTKLETIKGEGLLQIKREIHDRLIADQIDLYPYTRFTKASARAEMLANA